MSQIETGKLPEARHIDWTDKLVLSVAYLNLLIYLTSVIITHSEFRISVPEAFLPSPNQTPIPCEEVPKASILGSPGYDRISSLGWNKGLLIISTVSSQNPNCSGERPYYFSDVFKLPLIYSQNKVNQLTT